MSKFDQFLRTDNRVTTQMLRSGALTHEEVARQRKQLPDAAANAEYLPAYEEPTGDEAPTFEAV